MDGRLDEYREFGSKRGKDFGPPRSKRHKVTDYLYYKWCPKCGEWFEVARDEPIGNLPPYCNPCRDGLFPPRRQR
ncbi:MAG: hypothetical protein GY866_36460 [Proteobacteria bacterium]|nr:hypothetical protein [Pseudomonadota bacterium]